MNEYLNRKELTLLKEKPIVEAQRKRFLYHFFIGSILSIKMVH